MDSLATVSRVLLKFVARMACFTGQHHFILSKFKCCKHYDTLFLCSACGAQSKYMRFNYICHCKAKFCIMHFISFNHHYVHYTTKYEVILYDALRMSDKRIITGFDIPEETRSVSYLGHIYIIGGRNSSKVVRINTLTLHIAIKSPLQCRKYGFSVCCHDNFIYVIGGLKEPYMIITGECEKYDIAKDKWSQLPKLKTTRSYCTTFIWKKSIYAIFGFSNDCFLISAERMSLLALLKWEAISIANTPFARDKVYSMHVADGVLLVGGCNCYGPTNECYKLTWNGTTCDCSPLNIRLLKYSEFGKYACDTISFGHGYGIDDENNIHSLSYEDEKWTLIMTSEVKTI